MKLKVGKTYKTRDGQTVGNLRYRGGYFCFEAIVDGKVEVWDSEGRYLVIGKSPLDLIEEATPTPTNPS